jgi:hypothetical protein
LITTGEPAGVWADEPVATEASFHPSHSGRPRAECALTATVRGVSPTCYCRERTLADLHRDLTAELCEGYRRTLWIPPESPECS